MTDASTSKSSAGPSQPEYLTVDFIEFDGTITIAKRKGAGGGRCFLMLWLTGWTVGCIVLIGHVMKEPALGTFAFAVPFWASWFAVAGLLIWLWMGKELVHAHHEGLSFERHAWIRLSAREIPRREMIGFDVCQSKHTENDRYLYGIELETLGKPLRFLFDLPDNERTWLLYKLNAYYDFEKATSPAAGDPIEAERSRSANDEVLTLANSLAEPPTSCRWHKETEFESIAFWLRGKISWGLFFGLLFVNLFWNGIVSVFLLVAFGFMPGENNPQGWERVFLLVFLIPFVVIGLGMFFAFLLNLLEPIRVTRWTFDSRSVQRRTSWLFVKFNKRWDIETLDRVELRHIDREESKKFKDHMKASDQFDLVLVEQDNRDLCSIEGLTRGEALWIGHNLLTSNFEWFR